jgi:hypothetical protein
VDVIPIEGDLPSQYRPRAGDIADETLRGGSIARRSEKLKILRVRTLQLANGERKLRAAINAQIRAEGLPTQDLTDLSATSEIVNRCCYYWIGRRTARGIRIGSPHALMKLEMPSSSLRVRSTKRRGGTGCFGIPRQLWTTAMEL